MSCVSVSVCQTRSPHCQGLFFPRKKNGKAVFLCAPEDTVEFCIQEFATMEHKHDLGHLADDAATTSPGVAVDNKVF